MDLSISISSALSFWPLSDIDLWTQRPNQLWVGAKTHFWWKFYQNWCQVEMEVSVMNSSVRLSRYPGPYQRDTHTHTHLHVMKAGPAKHTANIAGNNHVQRSSINRPQWQPVRRWTLKMDWLPANVVDAAIGNFINLALALEFGSNIREWSLIFNDECFVCLTCLVL